MKLLSFAKVAEWTEERGIATPQSVGVEGARGRAISTKVRVAVPAASSELLGFSYMIAVTGVEDFREERFFEGLLCLRQWEIGSETDDQVGYTLLRALRGSAPSLSAAPGHLCERAEFALAQTLVAIALLMRWDAWFITADGELVADISHEGHVDFYSGSTAAQEELLRRFSQYELQVRSEH